MAYVPVPKDLSQIKSKFLFGLTKRQVVCFALGGGVGVGVFFLTKNSLGASTAVMLLIFCMIPIVMFAFYEKNGKPLEKILGEFYRWKFATPQLRLYKTQNFYEAMSNEGIKHRKEAKARRRAAETAKANPKGKAIFGKSKK